MTQSRRLVRAPAFAAVLATLAGGCLMVDDHHPDDVILVEDDPYYTTIDADHLLDTDLGYGAGLFVEYARGGVWRLWTSCDTALTGRGCLYEATLTSTAPIEAVALIDTEGYDDYSTQGDASLTFYAETANQLDMIEVVTAPGALVEIELWLDGYVSPEYFVWYGNGTVHDGAPYSPVVFQPDAP